MDHDDGPIGRILTRREVLALIGTTSAALLAACAPKVLSTATPLPTTLPTLTTGPTPAQQVVVATEASTLTPAAAQTTAPVAGMCVARPEATEGPYFVDERLDRSDIRSDSGTSEVRAGVPLTLTFVVSAIGDGCTPLAGAQVDVWHCDAAGVYSDVTDRRFSTVGQTFLRGYQTTDASGQAVFTTIFPGWYSGRAVHIHFKVRLNSGGQALEFTSQLFFDEDVNAAVFAVAPYAERGLADTPNAVDRIYRDELLVTATPSGDGYAARFDLGLVF